MGFDRGTCCVNYGAGDSSLNEDFPDARLGWTHAQEYLSTKFPSMSRHEMVALISGAHSIGRGHLRLSGYAGIWDPTPNVIDNVYHLELTQKLDFFGDLMNWQSGKLTEENSNAQSQFFLDNEYSRLGLPQDALFLMLNCDIELAYDLSYYIDRELFDDIDCSTRANDWCAREQNGTRVLYPGEEPNAGEIEGIDYCSLKQCKFNCNNENGDSEAELQSYKDNNYQNIPSSGSCPAAWIFEFADDNEKLGEVFVQGFIKMITAGYDVDDDLEELYL